MADRIRVQSSEVAAALEAQLSKYNEELNDSLAGVVERTIDDLVKRTKAAAPRGRRKGQFRKNIAADKKQLKRARRSSHGGFHGRVLTATWYVRAPEYRLTHLLVHGHELPQGGRSKGNPFLQNALDEVLPNYEREVEEVLRNG